MNGELYSNNDPTTSLFGVKKKVDRGYEASFVGVTPDGEISVEEITSAIKENELEKSSNDVQKQEKNDKIFSIEINYVTGDSKIKD